jgi:hypothetical protein
MPKEVHIKAGINPNIPVNSESFNFSKEFQNELNKLFTGGEDGGSIKIFDYTGDKSDDIQRFLISFSIKEQSLDFADYFSKDLDLDSNFQAIKQTFTLDPLSTAENNKISIDMSSTIDNILGKIEFRSVPAYIPVGWGDLPSISIPATGFTSLSFYEGDLKVTFSLPAGQSGPVELSELKVNSISSISSRYNLTAGNRTQEVFFPLKDKTLDSPLSLSFSYNNTGGMPVSLDAAIEFSNNVKLKTARGVSFDPIANETLGGTNPIDPGLPPEFVQAVIERGSVSLDTSAIKGVNLDLGGITLRQDDNAGAPDYEEQSLSDGLDNPLQSSLAGKKINPNPINITGGYSLTVSDPANTEITFTEDKKLEIPVSFSLNRFGAVYVNGEEIIEDFNKGKDSTIEKSLAGLGETVSEIEINEVGVALDFGESLIKGLELKIQSDKFMVSKQEPIEQGKKKTFTNESSGNPPFSFNIAANPTVTFNLELVGGSGTVLKLPPMSPGETVTIIDCTPEVIFDWEKATIDLNTVTGGANSFTKGTFPPEGQAPFSLGGQDLGKFLTNVKFEGINGYLFFSGPESFNDKNMNIDLTFFPDAANSIKKSGEITLIQTPLSLPEKDKPFTGKIGDEDLKGSLDEPIDFTAAFNRMLPSTSNGGTGEAMKIEYEMNLGKGDTITITKEAIEGEEGVKTIKADLVLILPLKLNAGPGGAVIDVTDYLGEMKGKNLLSFAENTGQTDISFNTLTLNVNMTGAPIKNGKLEIIRDAAKDGMGQIGSIDLSGKNISIPLAGHLGPSQKFTIDTVKLVIDDGGSLTVPRGLGLLSIGVDAGIDAKFGL